MKTNKWILLLLTGLLFMAELSAMESSQEDDVPLEEEVQNEEGENEKIKNEDVTIGMESSQGDDVPLEEEVQNEERENEKVKNKDVTIGRKKKSKSKSKKIPIPLRKQNKSLPNSPEISFSSDSDSDSNPLTKSNDASNPKKNPKKFFRINSSNKRDNPLITNPKDRTSEMFTAIRLANVNLIAELLDDDVIDTTRKNNNNRTVIQSAEKRGLFSLANVLRQNNWQSLSQEQKDAIKQEIKSIARNNVLDRKNNFIKSKKIF